jgi:hypothetical protein
MRARMCCWYFVLGKNNSFVPVALVRLGLIQETAFIEGVGQRMCVFCSGKGRRLPRFEGDSLPSTTAV